MTVKHDILVTLRDAGPASDAAALVLRTGSSHGAHGLTHVVWRLQKQGLVTFKTTKTAKRRQFPINIEITEAGRAYLDREE